MTPITATDIRRFAPKAKQHYVDALVSGWPDMVSAGLDRPLRLCHFLAQSHHETGGFTIVREATTWSHEQMCVTLWPNRFKKSDPVFRARYAAACRDPEEKPYRLAELAYGRGNSLGKSLGNCEDGDGWNYRGGGFQQGTGRAWYREVGEAIGVDLEQSPDLIENPNVSLKATIHYWTKHNLNRFADCNYGTAISRQINRGNPFSSKPANHEDRRLGAFDRAWAVWGSGELPSPNEIRVGAHGRDVLAIQTQLRNLKYAVGDLDEAYGEETARAVAAFKADWKRKNGQRLEDDDIVGPLTRAALAAADPITRPAREAMTAADLREKGSTEVAAGDTIKKAGTLAVVAAAVDGATKTGADLQVKEALSNVSGYKTAIEPAIDGAKWLIGHWLWAGVLVGGIWLYYGGHKVVMARLAAARNGFNLWR